MIRAAYSNRELKKRTKGREMKIIREVGRTFLNAGLLLVFAFGALAHAAEFEAPPPPGKLYEIGGRKMHLYATGESNAGPAVVLEAGGSLLHRLVSGAAGIGEIRARLQLRSRRARLE